jgi:predicted nucleic acid-binding protein
MTRIGFDTGFFVALSEDKGEAKQIWRSIIDGRNELVVSVLTIHELTVYFLRKGVPEETKNIIGVIHSLSNCEVLDVTEEIALKGAIYRHTFGMATVDSVIFATFAEADCDLIVTRDPDFVSAAKSKRIKLRLI